MCSFDLRVYVVFCLTVEEYLTYLPTSIIFFSASKFGMNPSCPQFLARTTRLDFRNWYSIYPSFTYQKNMNKKTFVKGCSLFLSHDKNKVKNYVDKDCCGWSNIFCNPLFSDCNQCGLVQTKASEEQIDKLVKKDQLSSE